MSLALLLVGDGRTELHERSWASAQENLPMQMFDYKITVDDSDHKLGFAGAIRTGWEKVLEGGADWCFWLELDFEFLRPVPLKAIKAVLADNSHLVQMALLRQPVNDAEVAAGGIVQQHPEEYKLQRWMGYPFLEHRKCFTTNPCLLSTWVMRAGWPQESESEGKFGLSLFASNPSLRSAFWGEGEEWVEHVGLVRTGHGY